MSSILLTWLNTEVNLSKKIKDLEEDFSNGYLLGELLHKFNQLTNKDAFRDENNQRAIRNNFDLLFEVLRNVGVKFNPNVARDIINKKKGVINNLLYEIRSNLEKKGVAQDNQPIKKSSHFQEMYVPMKFRQEIPQYDKFESKHFMETLKRLTKSQQDIDLEKKLKKFEDFKKRQDEQILRDIADEEAEKKRILEDKIKDHRSKNQRYHGFLQQFEEKGINNWKKNMLDAKKREMDDVSFELNQAIKMNKAIERGINYTINEYKRNVREFEEAFGGGKKRNHKSTLSKGNNNEDVDISNASGINLLDNANINNNGNLVNSCSYFFPKVDEKTELIKQAIYNKMMVNQQTKTERNRRRRKIIVEQSKAQLEIENRRREEQYINKLNKKSNQEKQLTYEVYRVFQSKKIIQRNRILREQKYEENQRGNIKFLIDNEKDFLKFHRENNKREIEKEENRRKDLEISKKQKIRNNNNKVCEHMVELIIDMTKQAYDYQQTNDSEKIDDRVWREWTNIFINNKSVLAQEDEEKKDESNVNYSKEENAENEINKSNVDGEEEGKENANEALGDIKPPLEDEHRKSEALMDELDSNNLTKYNNTFYSIFNHDAKCSNIDQILDECEFFDYIKFKGQWDKKIIPEEAFVKIDSQFLAFDYVPPVQNEQNAGGKKDNKGGKNVNANKGQNANKNDNAFDELIKNETEENLIIPKINVENQLFGDLIDILIEMEYEDENPLPELKDEQQKLKDEQLNDNFDNDSVENNNSQKIEDSKKENYYDKYKFYYVPLKICIIGRDFSGKKTQAKKLSENFPFKIYDVQELCKKAMDMLSKNTTQNKFLRSRTSMNANSTNNQAELDKEEQEEEKKYNEIRKLGSKIKSNLLDGEDISDETYAKLLIEYIKLDFPPIESKNYEEKVIERHKEKEDIQKSKEENKRENAQRANALKNREKELEEKEMKISLEETKGFVIVNFPKTLNQAKILEKELSKYIPETDKPINKTNKMKNLFEIVLDKTQNPPRPLEKYQGGLDLIFYLDVPSDECIKRAVGRRVYYNKETGEKKIYHLENNDDDDEECTPPTTSDICEHLQKIDDASNNESSLVTRHIAFDNTIDDVEDFYKNFGFEAPDININSFQKIDGAQQKDVVFQEIFKGVNEIVDINRKREDKLYEEYERSENESNENDDGSEDNNEGDNDNLQNSKDKSIDNSGNFNLQKKEEEEKKENAENNNNNQEKEQNNNINENEIANDNNDALNENNNINNQLKINYDNYINKVSEIRRSLDKGLSKVLLKIWANLYKNYVIECKSIFKFLRVQRDTLSEKYNLICQKFIEFLKRPSKKQIELLNYQMEYNEFLDQYPDLKDEIKVKDERHQKVDDLNDKIYKIIEDRKEEAVEERKKIMSSGWIENEMEKFYMALERLFQNEIDKFIGSMQIMRDYYHNLDNRPLVELPFTTIDIIKEEADNTPIEAFNEQSDNNNNNNENNNNNSSQNLPCTYPRIEKLYKNCLKIQFQYDEAIKEAEKAKQENANKENNNKKASNKPKDKKGGNTISQEEEKAVVYKHNDELEQALTNEKKKYKYKITLLKYWGINCLRNIRSISLSVYNKLEDWIILAIRAENEALEQLTTILKEKIEEEKKIQYELELKVFDVIINKDVQNYRETPPEPLPAKEKIDHEKFNITQLEILIDELNTYIIKTYDENNVPDNKKYIRSSTFINIFIKKFVASQNDNDVYYGIPNLLKNLKFYNYFKFIKRLDPDNNDKVSLKQVCTYFALLTSPVASEQDVKSINEQLEQENIQDDMVDLKQFVNINFWFDANEHSEDLPLHHKFEREKKLKEIIFNIMKDEGSDTISMKEFIDVITLKDVKDYTKSDNYFKCLFQ